MGVDGVYRISPREEYIKSDVRSHKAGSGGCCGSSGASGTLDKAKRDFFWFCMCLVFGVDSGGRG